MSLLAVDDLSVRFGATAAVDRVSFRIDKGEAVGLVGASGSGKSQTALALLGLSPRTATVTGQVQLNGVDLIGAAPDVIRRQRARHIAMVFQDPALALNPYLTVGRQLGEILRAHGLASGASVHERIVAALARVGLPDPERQAGRYPHQLSGGMRQRVMIAAALIAEPDLLVADEPTTALDVTVQASVLDMLDDIRGETALLLITHDLGIVAGHCERMLVLDEGRLVEAGHTASLFREPQHAKTRELLDEATLAALPDTPVESSELLLNTDGLTVAYRMSRRQSLRAVDAVDIALAPGETLAIVGESGAGKTSLAHAIAGLIEPADGSVVFGGKALPSTLAGRATATLAELQLVFQDPTASLSPSMPVRDIVAEPLTVHEPALGSAERSARVDALLGEVGLDAGLADAMPHELSGGQAQRVAIARAIILKPRVLICDEAVAALDGAVRRRVLELLADVQQKTGLAVIFITHDLAVVRSIAHRVAVMYLGRVVESGPTSAVFRQPRHPYTRALLDAVPVPDPQAPGGMASLEGEPPSPLAPPPGCGFAPRCRFAEPRCSETSPVLEPAGASRAACIRAAELELTAPAAESS